MRRRNCSFSLMKGTDVESAEYAGFRADICDENRCWQVAPVSEAGVTADKGAGWVYFLSESHFGDQSCMGRGNSSGGICDAVAVPRQYRGQLVFLELKTNGSYAHAVDQIRACVERILAYGVPRSIALTAEIWHSREPKSTLVGGQSYIEVEGRQVSIRRKRST